LACLVAGGLVGCGGGEQREEGATLTVLAASSLYVC
jgi:ABC-type molybdate transport system substrate-binding protein